MYTWKFWDESYLHSQQMIIVIEKGKCLNPSRKMFAFLYNYGTHVFALDLLLWFIPSFVLN